MTYLRLLFANIGGHGDQQREQRATNFDCNVVVTCEIKLFQNYFSLRRRPSQIILFQSVETCLELMKLMNIFQHV